MEQITFTKERLSVSQRFSRLLMDEILVKTGKSTEDFISNTFSVQINAFFASREQETKTMVVYAKRPTFWEWITRKPRSFTFEINAREVLVNPPALAHGQSISLYTFKETTDL